LPSKNSNDLDEVLAANPLTNEKFAFKKRFEFTMKQDEMKGLITKLDHCNREFSRFIEDIDDIHRLELRSPSKQGEAKQLAASLHQVRDKARTLHEALTQSWAAGCHPVHETLLRLECRSAMPQDSGKLPHHPQPSATFTMFIASGSQASSVGLSWRQTTFDFVDESDSSCLKEENEVDAICGTLGQAAHAGRALLLHLTRNKKVFRDEAIALQPQATAMRDDQPLSLESFLSGTEQLDYKERTILALSLASSLLQFQTTQWIERPWNKKAIRLLRDQTNSQSMESCQPLVSRIFSVGQSREALQPPENDLLELGILMLEIWEQRTLESWTNASGLALEDSSYSRMFSALRWFKERSGYLPPTYGDAVSVCIKFSFEGVQHDWDNPNFRRAVCEKVISPLRENCKAWSRGS
jgi:hypothetical protein